MLGIAARAAHILHSAGQVCNIALTQPKEVNQSGKRQ